VSANCIQRDKTMMIPKVVHYCWFGKSKKPKLVRRLYPVMEKHLPDYEIIEWNESNLI
jgi:mannosyltransferase OCH1-like enzyme